MAEQKKTSTTTDTGSSSGSTSEDQSGDSGQAEVQATFDEAAEKGYFGEVPDETPNENYTLQGVGKGLPTPETDRTGTTDKK